MTTDMKTTIAERPRYFPRQVITADDLTADQDYFREKLRRHNRMLHGWGIRCGALVEPVKNTDGTDKPWFVKINPGYIIAPYGDEICIGKVVCCDLRIKCSTAVVSADPNPCADSVTQAPPPAGGTFFVVIQYLQEATRPVRLKASGCGCGENPCENSRYRDSYQVCVLDTLPASHNPQPRPTAPRPDCPALPPDGWVVLAKVTVGADGKIVAKADGTPNIDYSDCHVLAAPGA
jgi:hypothetical protein